MSDADLPLGCSKSARAAPAAQERMEPASQTQGPDSRAARREAIQAGLLWFAALVATVGLSTWLGSDPPTSVLGVPRWAAFGIFLPWVAFFVLHVRFYLRGTGQNRKA